MTLEIGYSKENGDKKPTGDHPYLYHNRRF